MNDNVSEEQQQHKDDIVSNMQPARAPNHSSKTTVLSRPENPSVISFRRCSLDHARSRHHHPVSSDTCTCSTASCSSFADDSTVASTRQRRRSSLKTSTSRPRAASTPTPNKCVTFRSDVLVKEIEFRDKDSLKAAWLSKEERQDIQFRAKADLKVIKHLSKHPEDRDTPGFRDIRSNISLRGLEHFVSKRIQRSLILEQQDVIYSVLETQELQRQCSPHVGTLYGPAGLAKLSAERSLPGRERALRQGKEDEAAVLSYLGRSTRRKKSADQTQRRSSMPGPAVSSSTTTDTKISHHGETSSGSSRSFGTL
eukprot:CAMPEP_0181023286 /NCGR_PEP_ID=MMETSP1070-20121207/1971_1 /TAXON_ID=265543 /ORGANISM="Minutocellus polymorphus, Strain NH13" /LENGTH=310 /DNA_ID=CAMNT_0023100293 /DNA_START=17 /DNA_END=949 /DNA_ORIENTATION=+